MEEHGGHATNHSAPSQAISLEAHLSHSGLLPSHVYFGSCLFILGAWWLTGVLRTQSRRSKVNRAVLTFPGTCGPCSGQVLEGLVQLIACVIGIIIESITVSRMGRPENYTYSTIYSSFMLAALVNILAGLRIVLPEGIDFLAHAVAFANLGVLARAQAWGHLHLTVATRLLTSYVAMFAAFALVMELYRPQSHILKFIRTGAVMLQGVWFLQAGLVLDSPFAERWIEEDHANLMFITIAFSWDMCGVVLFQIFFAAIMEKLCGGSNVEDHRQRPRTTEGVRTIKDVSMNGVDEYKPLQTLESLESEGVMDAQ